MICVLSSFNSVCVCSLGLLLYWFVKCLSLCSMVFSNCCFWFFLYDEYDMIWPLITALSVPHSSDGEFSGESFISMKNAHSVFINATKSGSSKSDVLKCYLVEGLVCAWAFIDRETGAWSLIIIELIMFSEIYRVSELLRKRSSLDEDQWTEEKYVYSLKDGFLIELPGVLEWLIVGSMTVFKSIMSLLSCTVRRKGYERRMGDHCLGHKC